MPVTMSGYGQSYMPMGGPGVGAAIYGAQRQEVNFARMVELQRLNLQKRALRQQAAAQAAQLQQREQARQDELAMQQTRFDLEERRLDMMDEENQRRRQDVLDAFERAERDRQEREAQAILDEKNRLTEVGATPWDGSGEQPSRYYTTRDGMVWDLSRVDMGKVRGSSQQTAPNADAIRKELNTLSAQGARPLGEGESYDERTHYPYITADGRVWLVQRTDGKGNPVTPPEKQQKPSPVEGYGSEDEYNLYYQRYGEQASNPQYVQQLKAMDANLKNTARNLGVVKLEQADDGTEREVDGNLSMDNLRTLANNEKAFIKQAKLKDVKTPWQDKLAQAEAMVELHDAREAMLHQEDGNKDYDEAKKTFKAVNTKPFMDSGYRGAELQERLEAAWKERGRSEYARKTEKRYQSALQTARGRGWRIPTGKGGRRIDGAFIDEMYGLFMLKK